MNSASGLRTVMSELDTLCAISGLSSLDITIMSGLGASPVSIFFIAISVLSGMGEKNYLGYISYR